MGQAHGTGRTHMFSARITLILAIFITLPGAALAEFDKESPTVLITGANRGLGLEFTRQYAAAGPNI